MIKKQKKWHSSTSRILDQEFSASNPAGGSIRIY